ncbi:Protein transport protein SFT2 [Nymphon striatum]|nr:Protein transport protein SFT2 [Nymphon striatum]
MSNLSRDLKSYLDRTDQNESNQSLLPNVIQESTFGKWLNKGRDSETTNENSNGWFSEAEKDPYFPHLSKTQRVVGFVGFLVFGTFCFVLAGIYAPLLVLKARKFALLYSLGSLFYIMSFSLLWGPWNHIRHLFSMERLPFTTVYFGTMFATLYFSLWIRSTIMTVICATLQIIALLCVITSSLSSSDPSKPTAE